MPGAGEVLEYLDWWEGMLWREEQRLDPAVSWQRDMSFDEIAAAAGVDPPLLAPGELPMDVDLALELYWPGPPAA